MKLHSTENMSLFEVEHQMALILMEKLLIEIEY